MGGRDLKFVASLENRIPRGLDQVTAKILADQEKFGKQQITLQRNSITYQEQLRARTQKEYEGWWQRQLAITDRAERRILTIQRQAAVAESALVLDKFDRRIAVERTKHAQILADLKGNDAAQEAEVRRHNAVVGRIQMDKANLPNTPFQQLLTGVKQGVGFQNGIGGVALMAGGALGASVAISSLTAAMGTAIDKAKEFNTINRALTFAAGGSKEAAVEFAYVREEAQRLGVPLLDAAKSYAQMAAAAKGTRLEGQATRDVFKGITEASVSLGLSGDQTAGAINALQQMISKGTVQSEELRGQLGERIPGAFQIAARAMGMTTAQLGKALEQGQVYADDFLPRFATELHKTFGETAVNAAGEAQQAITKMNNTLGETAAAAGKAAIEVGGVFARSFNFLAEGIKGAADAQQRYNEQMLAATNPKLAAEFQAQNKIREEGMRLAREAKAQEDMKTAGPTNAQSAALAAMLKEEAAAKKAALAQAKRDAEEQARFDDAAAANAEKREAKFQKAVEARAREVADLRYDQQVKAQAQIKAAKDRVAMAQAEGPGGSAMDKLKAQQAVELEQYAGNEAAKTLIIQAQAKERTAIEVEESQKKKELQKKEQQERLGAVAGFFGGVAQLTAQANMHERSARLRWKAAAIAEATANTALAATKSLTAAPYPYNLLLMAGTIAAGIGQINQIKDQKFAMGTDYAPGGMALVGERGPEMVYLPRGSQVKTASETASMRSPTLAPTINIHMGPGTTRADAQAVADAVDARLRSLARDMKEIEYRGITA